MPDIDWDEQAEILRGYARWDWVYATTGSDCLHAPAEATYDAHAWLLTGVTMACGWKVDTASIPGMFSRMGAPRCSHCCDRTGLPRGVGSPKNDQRCRIILGIPCTRPQQDYDGPPPIPVCKLPTGHDGDHDYIRDGEDSDG